MTEPALNNEPERDASAGDSTSSYSAASDAAADKPAPERASASERAPEPDPQLRRDSIKAVVKYGLARFVLFIVLTLVIEGIAVLIGAHVPLLIAAMLALFVALPLSMLIFTKWRVEATESLAEYSKQRKEHKKWIQRELAGR